jgi:hypothetical protein
VVLVMVGKEKGEEEVRPSRGKGLRGGTRGDEDGRRPSQLKEDRWLGLLFEVGTDLGRLYVA